MRAWAEVRFVYAIREDRPKGLLKIGSATDVPKRLKALQRETERPLVLHGVEAWVGSHARMAEAFIHHDLRLHRAPFHIVERRGLKGGREWFYPKPEVLEYVADWSPDCEDALTFELRRVPLKDKYPWATLS